MSNGWEKPRGSSVQHHHQAMRFRELAANATTARARKYLLEMAEQYDALAAGRITAVNPVMRDADEAPDETSHWIIGSS